MALASEQQQNLQITRIPRTQELHVQARQSALELLLAQLAAASHLKFHYTGLAAQQQISGDCISQQLNQLLTCLLGATVNTVIRYAPNNQAEEAWLLGGEMTSKNPLNHAFIDIDSSEAEAEFATTELLSQAQSQNQAERAAAIVNLGTAAVTDKAAASKLLCAALVDHNPEIRATAINSLMRVDPQTAHSESLQLLNDSEQTVRLAVVVAGYNDTEILQAASSDNDAQVRNLAEISLNRLQKNQGQQP